MNSYAAVCRLRDVIRRQHMAYRTESVYVYWLKRYMRALPQLPPNLTSEKKVERFLTDLATISDVAASTQNQAFNALIFFYQHVLEQPLQSVEALRASRPVHLRHAPTVAEVRALLPAVPDLAGYPTNLITRLIYGAGLRVTEPLNLRIKDLNLEKSSLFILGAKGGQDRVVPLPGSLRTEITQQIYLARVTWQRDKQNKIPLLLPHQLARKYPEYQFSWSWAWLFPAKSTCHDRRTGQTIRFRMQESFVQRAIKQARNKLGIQVLPHELRHHSECRIIPIDASGLYKNQDFSSILGFHCRHNRVSFPCKLRNSAKGKDKHESSILFTTGNLGPIAFWSLRAAYRRFCGLFI